MLRRKPKKVSPEELNERLLNIAEDDLKKFIEASLGTASHTYQSVLSGSLDAQAGLQYTLENIGFAAQGTIVYLNRLEERERARHDDT